jgi:hypothetical protein
MSAIELNISMITKTTLLNDAGFATCEYQDNVFRNVESGDGYKLLLSSLDKSPFPLHI